MTFQVHSWGTKWITLALRTITPKHQNLGRISISVHRYSSIVVIGGLGDVKQVIGGQTIGQWLELDRLLAQLWESHSIRPEILYRAVPPWDRTMTDLVGWLLPETTGGGIINLVNTL